MPEPKIIPTAIIDTLEHIGNPFEQRNWQDELPPDITLDGAAKDYALALQFLYSYNGSEATFIAYRRDVERLLQWSWRIAGTSIRNLRRENIEEFLEFYRAPPASWIGTKNVARFVKVDGLRCPNVAWRPFVIPAAVQRATSKKKTHSRAAIQATFAILASFYDFMFHESGVESNPFDRIRQKSKYIQQQQGPAPVRRISNLQWQYVIETTELLAEKNPAVEERSLFIINCLYAMYLRISELVADSRSTPTMSDFRRDQDGNWWFDVVGKGNKSRSVSVSDDMLEALKRYRVYRGLSPLPSVGEFSALIPALRNDKQLTSSRHIRVIVQRCFDEAYSRMCSDGLGNDAEELRRATVHWLRHTGISEDVKFRPREHVRDDAGHMSMQTTDRYIHSDPRERHRSAKSKRIKDA